MLCCRLASSAAWVFIHGNPYYVAIPFVNNSPLCCLGWRSGAVDRSVRLARHRFYWRPDAITSRWVSILEGFGRLFCGANMDFVVGVCGLGLDISDAFLECLELVFLRVFAERYSQKFISMGQSSQF